MEDKQLAAMQKVVEALAGLEDTDLRVVLGFIGMRYGAAGSANTAPAGTFGVSTDAPAGNGGDVAASSFATFPDLYHAANPATEADKALVGGYWAQVCQGQESFDSFTVNKSLKDMGYTVSNITRAIDALMAQEPKYVQQIKKSGTTRQARKLYRVTQAGMKRVAEMLRTAQQ